MHLYLRDRLILVSALAGLLVNILLWFILVGKFRLSVEPIPLHFNIVYGIDLVGKATQIYEIPAAGLVILLLNFWLGKYFYKMERLFSYFLNFAALFIQILLVIGAINLIVLIS